jgi:hypothetical protein
MDSRRSTEKSPEKGFNTGAAQLVDARDGVRSVNRSADPGEKQMAAGAEDTGLKQHQMTTPTVVFMIFCLCAAGAYEIEEMIPAAGPGLTIVMLFMSAYVLILA